MTNDINIKFMIGYLKELQPEQFDIGDWGVDYGEQPTQCGTVACIAGWTAFAFTSSVGTRPWDTARQYLGLTIDEGADLFVNEKGFSGSNDGATTADAIIALEKLMYQDYEVSVWEDYPGWEAYEEGEE